MNKKYREIEIDGLFGCMKLSSFEEKLAITKNFIEKSYPDVNLERDISINFNYDEHLDEYSVTLEFYSLETEQERIERIKKEKRNRKIEKERILTELKKLLKDNPEFKDELVNLSKLYE